MMFSMKKTVFTSSAAVVALALTACGSAGSAETSAPQTSAATTAAATSSSQAAMSASPSPTLEGPAETGTLLAALEQGLAARPGGIVVQADEEDETQDSFDLAIVVDGVKHEFTLFADGSIADEETSDDADDVARAGAAQVLAADAVRTAAEGRGGQVATDLDLDDQNGALVWEVDFEDARGNDVGSVKVDALTGEVLPAE
ncbi:PepSY domain-containing protein [Rothia sp. (in: high G+C Gram-positive bacteria)]|uniref:PepSY domain-containing protein n=1 Tax=Rothia sp. (in: high G+C Gram-positive bacteria) TaxID=1885016 RepID=UPI0032180C18